MFRFASWGTPFWQVLHAVTFNYPPEPTASDKTRMRAFIQLVPYLLPCGLCGQHFFSMLQTDEPLTDAALASRDTLARWMVRVHNRVNKRLHKAEVRFEDVYTFYMENYRHRLRPQKRQWLIGVTVAIVVLLLALATGAGCYVRLRG